MLRQAGTVRPWLALDEMHESARHLHLLPGMEARVRVRIQESEHGWWITEAIYLVLAGQSVGGDRRL